jgi:hypothetical protein
MISIIKNFPVVIHQLFFLFSQLLILYIFGIGYSGSLAYIGAISTFIAVLINLRWDIEIMVNKSQRLSLSLSDASITIIFMTFAISLLNVVFGSPIQIYIILSALAIAIHELLVSVLFIQKKIYVYSFFRTIPAISLISFALVGFEPEMVWPASFFLSVFFLVIYFRNLLKKAIVHMSLKRIKKIKLINKINAAITATTFSFFSALFIIIINYYYGDDYVGLWANTIRIFNSALIFLLAAGLPFALNMLRDKNFVFEKVMTFFYLWFLLLPLIVVSFFIVSNFGISIFSIFKTLDSEITNTNLSIIFLIGTAISFIGSTQGLYQAINKSITLFFMILITSLFGIFAILSFTLTFTVLIKIFLLLTMIIVSMILIHFIYHLTYKIK